MKIYRSLVLLVLFAGSVWAVSMRVQVQSAKVREKPSQLGRVVATVKYNDTVEAGPPQKGWHAVTTRDGKTGWLHTSALTGKRLAMRAGSTDAAVGVSSDEVALAGKGFNEQVEAKLKQDGVLDFTWVDRMAAFSSDTDQIRAFRSEGHLTGGAQ